MGIGTPTSGCSFTQLGLMPQPGGRGWKGIQHQVPCFQSVTRRLSLGIEFAEDLKWVSVS